MFSSTKREGLGYVLMYRIQMVLTITGKNEWTFTRIHIDVYIYDWKYFNNRKKYTFLFLNVY